MIEIIVNGVSLDMATGEIFELDLEQPMFNSEHIPVPYSTAIAFLPTETNCRVFGYFPGLMLPPQKNELSADLLISGIHFVSGTLIYDSIEDGMIKYSFVGKNVDDRLSWDISMINCGSTGSLDDIQAAKSTIGGNGEKFAAPLMINKSAVSDITYASFPSGRIEPVDISVKYHNWPYDSKQIFTPTISVRHLVLRTFSEQISFDDNIDRILKHVHIIGLYKPDATSFCLGFPSAYVSIGKTLPALSQGDLLQNCLKLFGAFIFQDGREYIMRSGAAVLAGGDILDWDEMIGNDESLSRETAQGYSFGYADKAEDTYDVANLKDDVSDGDVQTVSSMEYVLGHFDSDGYKAVMHENTGDIFSGKTQDIAIHDSRQFLIDNIYQNIPSATNGNDFDDIFDCNVEFELVRCVPDRIHGDSLSYCKDCMVPIIEPAAIGADRNSKVYIGLMIEGQMCDKGVVLVDSGQPVTPGYFIEKDYGMSLAPEALYESFHKGFADWLATDRTSVKVSLHLPVSELVAFRMYKKVHFRGRQWIVRKLSITMSVLSDILEVTGEFVSV